MSVNAQKVVVYHVPGDGPRVYDTCYTGEQAREATRRCEAEHGEDAHVHVISAAEHAARHA